MNRTVQPEGILRVGLHCCSYKPDNLFHETAFHYRGNYWGLYRKLFYEAFVLVFGIMVPDLLCFKVLACSLYLSIS